VRKMLVRTAVVTCMSGFALAGVAAPAFAGTAPACVSRVLQTFNVVTLTNNCGVTMRVKVVWDYAADSPCYTLANGESRTVTQYHYPTAQYGKTVTC
jgi:hypothetical protein